MENLYKFSQSTSNQIFKFNQKSINDEDDSVEYNMSLLMDALEYLSEYHEKVEEEYDDDEFNDTDIELCTKDIHYALTSGKDEINNFVDTNYVIETLINYFSTAQSFVESYGLLKCFNGIIQNQLIDSDSLQTEVFFQQFQKINRDLIKDDDEIQYLALYIKIFHQINHQSNIIFFNENFFQHLLSFQNIDNEIDAQIIMIFIQLYKTLPSYPDCLIKETINIFANVPFHTSFQCANLFNIISNKFPELLNENLMVNAFKQMFNYGQFPTRALLLKSLIVIPYSISCGFISESVNCFVSDSIVKLSTIMINVSQKEIENSDFLSIELLNYLLENDGDTFLKIFFDDYNLLGPLICIMENASYSYKEIAGRTFLLFIDILLQMENNDIFHEFVEDKDFPGQFASFLSLVFNLDNIEMKNRLIDYTIMFLEKVSLISAQDQFIFAIESFDIIQDIIDDDEIDQELTEVLINQFFPEINDC